MTNHDSPDVQLINKWLDNMTSRQRWAAFARYWWRWVWRGRRGADVWLLTTAFNSGVNKQ